MNEFEVTSMPKNVLNVQISCLANCKKECSNVYHMSGKQAMLHEKAINAVGKDLGKHCGKGKVELERLSNLPNISSPPPVF